MTAEIKELTDLADLDELSRLLATVWRSAQTPLNADTLKALAVSRNYVAGAYIGGRLVGGLVGWLGGRPGGDLHMHSHILGVLPGNDQKGLGFDLKQHQRRWCLDRDVHVMEWTTDPLVRRNVYFNVAKLGAEAPEYFVNFYGQMRDGLNAGEESDRLLIRWQLDSDRALAAAQGKPREPETDTLRRWATDAILVIGRGDKPISAQPQSRVLLIQVPDDIVALRSKDPALAREWRLALRHAIREAIANGYAITGATRSGWYVLEST